MSDTQEYRRLSVNLIPKAEQAVTSSMSREQLSRTDIVNRALILYDFLGLELAAGGELLVREPGSAELSRIQLL